MALPSLILVVLPWRPRLPGGGGFYARGGNAGGPGEWDRLIVSGATTGSGLAFVEPEAIAIEADGQLVVVDSSSRAVVRVDPVSGGRAVVSDATTGRGQFFSFPATIAVESTGQMVADTALQAVVRVNPVSGDRMLVAR